MKTKLAAILLVAVIVMAFQNSPVKEFKIKRTVNLKTGNTTDYFYDTQGRISMMQNSKGTKTTYDYLGNTIIKKLIDSKKGANTADTFLLNDKNRVVTISGSTYGNQKLEYDSKGRFIKSMNYHGSEYTGGASWVWEGENLKEYTYADEKGKIINRLTYFYTDKANTISDRNMGMEYFGTDNKDLVKKSIGVFNSDTAIPTYNYHFNSNGSVNLKVAYSMNGKLIDSIGYTYY